MVFAKLTSIKCFQIQNKYNFFSTIFAKTFYLKHFTWLQVQPLILRYDVILYMQHIYYAFVLFLWIDCKFVINKTNNLDLLPRRNILHEMPGLPNKRQLIVFIFSTYIMLRPILFSANFPTKICRWDKTGTMAGLKGVNNYYTIN